MMNDNNTMQWLESPCAAPSLDYKNNALARQESLTKPPGSLGRLESIAVALAAIQHSDAPSVDNIAIHIFAADHGIAAEGVSAFPQVVTGEMIRNFSSGGAAISVLAQQLNASLQVHNLGTVNAAGIEDEIIAGVRHYGLGLGTANFIQQAAMTEKQLAQALNIGKIAAEDSIARGCQLLIAGEMGIANTTSATALACALLNEQPSQIVGPGTGLKAEGIAHKCKIIEQALAFHNDEKSSVLEKLRLLGGFEIAALVGFYLRAAQLGAPVLVDGFICSIAALYANHINEHCQEYFILSHQSAEPGHSIICRALKLQPLLDLNMRLGEGSGAAIAAHLLRSACALHNNMATFSQASVSQGES